MGSSVWTVQQKPMVCSCVWVRSRGWSAVELVLVAPCQGPVGACKCGPACLSPAKRRHSERAKCHNHAKQRHMMPSKLSRG